MSFGSRLRELREARGWSRHKLSMKMGNLLTEPGIKALERSTNQEPHNGTRANLVRIFPELDNNVQPFIGIRQNYPSNLTKPLVFHN